MTRNSKAHAETACTLFRVCNIRWWAVAHTAEAEVMFVSTCSKTDATPLGSSQAGAHVHRQKSEINMDTDLQREGTIAVANSSSIQTNAKVFP